MLTPETLQQALTMQTLWTARELALWHSGTYEFHPGEQLPADTAGQRIDPQRVVMEVLRYEQEWEGCIPICRRACALTWRWPSIHRSGILCSFPTTPGR